MSSSNLPNIDDPYQNRASSLGGYPLPFHPEAAPHGQTTTDMLTFTSDMPPPVPHQYNRTMTANIIDDMEPDGNRLSTTSSYWERGNDANDRNENYNVYQYF